MAILIPFQWQLRKVLWLLQLVKLPNFGWIEVVLKQKLFLPQKLVKFILCIMGILKNLNNFLTSYKPKLFQDTKSITKNMEKRGGGIMDINIK